MTKLGEVRKSWKRRWFKLDGEVTAEHNQRSDMHNVVLSSSAALRGHVAESFSHTEIL